MYPMFLYLSLFRAVLLIAHGVGEHSGRYESLATLLNEHKYVVYSHDYGKYETYHCLIRVNTNIFTVRYIHA